MRKKRLFVVIRGRHKGLFADWMDCADEIYGYRHHWYRAFSEPLEALDYMQCHMNYGGTFILSAAGEYKIFDDLWQFMDEAERVLWQMENEREVMAMEVS